MAEAFLARGAEALTAKPTRLDDAEAAFTEAAAAAAATAAAAPSPAAASAAQIVVARAYANLGTIRARRGAPAEALAFNEKALLIFRQLGDGERACVTLFNSALFADAGGDRDKAAAFMSEVERTSKDASRVAEAKAWLSRNAARGGASQETRAPSRGAADAAAGGGRASPTPVSSSPPNAGRVRFTPPEELDELSRLGGPPTIRAAPAATPSLVRSGSSAAQ